jgi:hypothetical protein
MMVEKVFKKYKLGDEPKDVVFWRTKSYQERWAALAAISTNLSKP